MKKESNHNHNYIQFITAVKATQKSKDFDELYATMRDVFQLKSIHPSVKEYIESTIEMELVAGPLYFDGFGKSYKGAALINHYYYADKHAPKDRLLPAIQFAYAPSGHEYYLFLESGQVVGGHHDTIWAHHFDYVFSKKIIISIKLCKNFYQSMLLKHSHIRNLKKCSVFAEKNTALLLQKNFPAP